MTFARFCLAAALLLAVSGVAGAEDVYRWVDEDGNVHYSDRAENDRAERVVIDPDSPSTAPDEGEDGNTTANPEKCKTWKRRLTSLQTSDEVYRQLPDGSQEILTEDERQLEVERARLAVDRYCAGASPEQ